MRKSPVRAMVNSVVACKILQEIRHITAGFHEEDCPPPSPHPPAEAQRPTPGWWPWNAIFLRPCVAMVLKPRRSLADQSWRGMARLAPGFGLIAIPVFWACRVRALPEIPRRQRGDPSGAPNQVGIDL